MDQVTDVSSWTRIHSDRKHPFWWGILGLIAIEVVVVAIFAVSFIFLWIVSFAEGRSGFFPPDYGRIPLLYPTLETVLLGLCSLSMWWGGVAMERGKSWHFVWTVVFCCTAGLVVLRLRWLQLLQLPFGAKEHAYGSFVWILTGFHFLHVASAVLGTIVIGIYAAKGYYTKERRIGVQVDTMYWYFVSVGWLGIYLLLYFLPKWG